MTDFDRLLKKYTDLLDSDIDSLLTGKKGIIARSSNTIYGDADAWPYIIKKMKQAYAAGIHIQDDDDIVNRKKGWPAAFNIKGIRYEGFGWLCKDFVNWFSKQENIPRRD